MGATWARLTDRSLPANRSELYFHENPISDDCKKLLCCPTAVGCVVREYDPKDPAGGRPVYSVSRSNSYSEFVPRYEIRALGIKGASLVGVLDKEETHLRTKLGEYICMQLWKIKHNDLVMRHHGKAYPHDSRSLHVVIAKQAKIDITHNEYQDVLIHTETERWVETFSTDLPGLAARLPNELYKTAQEMDKLSLYWQRGRVGVAKKQGFAGAIGGRQYGRPYIGLELATILHSEYHEQDAAEVDRSVVLTGFQAMVRRGQQDFQSTVGDQEHPVHRLLPANRLRMLLLTLAWSEKTMDCSSSDETTETFIQVESSEWVHLHKWEEHVPSERGPRISSVTDAGTPRGGHVPVARAPPLLLSKAQEHQGQT
eukprot:TRINITY_DN14584_c0_g1_i1.p1 TRINITY_DN14584_c0_g1~~TRINITY_DN14584_c0_g1_i1.p1  ORF type:complete len:370 (+),score=32.23 TRINITY_DN14584_c0_g1_i1:25-1134(+)